MSIFHKIVITILIILSLPISVKPQSTPSEPGDVLALTPWELLGEDDGLGDSFSKISNFQSDLVDFAMKYLGSRYRAGGKTPKGFDCSGFTSFVFNNFDISLSPASRLQGKEGTRVNLDELQVGDLMFFSGRRGGNSVGHVGMVIDVDKETGIIKFIHSSSSQGVVITTFPDDGYYSRRYLHSTRVIDEEKL